MAEDKNSLSTGVVNLNTEDVEEKRCLAREDGKFSYELPEADKKSWYDGTVVYRYVNANTKRKKRLPYRVIEMMLREEWEQAKCMDYGRDCVAVCVTFEESTVWNWKDGGDVLALCGGGIRNVRVGAVTPNVEARYVATGPLAGLEECEVIEVTKTRNLRFWGYGVGMEARWI